MAMQYPTSRLTPPESCCPCLFIHSSISSVSINFRARFATAFASPPRIRPINSIACNVVRPSIGTSFCGWNEVVFRAYPGSLAISTSLSVILPDVGVSRATICLTIVDFPAPFGPRRPNTSPRFTPSEIPSLAREPFLYSFTRSSISRSIL